MNQAGTDFDQDESAEGGGQGRDRDDASDADDEFMPMSRRDVDTLYRSALGDMREFLEQRKAHDPTKSLMGVAIAGTEIAAGAAIAGFLAQRFRQAGAVVPVGVILGAVGLAASQFEMFGRASPDVRNVSLGALASAAALWAAGRGVIGAEEAAGRAGTRTAGAALPAPQPQPQPQQVFAFSQQHPPYPQHPQHPYAQQPYVPPPYAYAAPVAYYPAPQQHHVQPQPVAAMADFESLVGRRIH